MNRLALLSLFALGVACQATPVAETPAGAAPAAPSSTDPAERYGASHARSDPAAIDIAESVLEAMGGREAWNETRAISWNFFGGRRHVWDKELGRSRIEHEDLVLVFDLGTRTGRAWKAGVEVTDAEELADLLEQGHRMWVNDSYWVFMPYKLLDPGVILTHVGRGATVNGREGEVLQLTFDEVGHTPGNAYRVVVADETGLVEEWSFWEDATTLDAAPRFTMPWTGWELFGDILLATDHGRGADWAIEVHSELPAGAFD